MMHPLFLIGFMGSGKTTVGQTLSEQYHLSFVDTDAYIENKHGMEVAKIFSKYGEDTFRMYEHEALQEVLSIHIIATGGGIVERNENIFLMQQKGTIIYLQTSFSEIDERLKGDVSRPLWINSDLAMKRELFNRRHQLYEQCAQMIIQTDRRTVTDIATEIMHKLSLNAP